MPDENAGKKAYVAAPSVIWARARAKMDELEADGYVIAEDWTRAFREGTAAEIAADPARSGEAAAACLAGVVAADVLVLLVTPGIPSVGCWVELGAALALGKEVIACLPEGFTDEEFRGLLEQHLFLLSAGIEFSGMDHSGIEISSGATADSVQDPSASPSAEEPVPEPAPAAAEDQPLDPEPAPASE